MFRNRKIVHQMNEIVGKFESNDINILYKIDEKSYPNKLVKLFFKLIKTCKMNVSNIRELIKGLLHVVTEISTFNVSLTHFSNDLEKEAIQVKESSQAMGAAIEQTNASMLQVAETISESAASAEEIATQADTLLELTNTNDGMIQQINNVNKDVSQRAAFMDEDTKNLLSVIEDMKKIVAGINEIAGHTNLLALNASIEAARAGENGRGFAVVADEVRKLAENTKMQLISVEELMNSMENASNKSRESVKYTVDAIKNMDIYTKKITTSFSDSKIAIESVISGVKVIADSTEELSAASQQVSAAMHGISEDSENLLHISDDLYEKSFEINELGMNIGKIEDVVSDLAKIGGKMSNEEYFKISNDDFVDVLDNAIKGHMKWIDTLENMALDMEIHPIQTDGMRCKFGHFYYAVNPVHPQIKKIWDEIDQTHLELHKLGFEVINHVKNGDQQSAQRDSKGAKALSEKVLQAFILLKETTNDLSNQGVDVF